MADPFMSSIVMRRVGNAKPSHEFTEIGKGCF